MWGHLLASRLPLCGCRGQPIWLAKLSLGEKIKISNPFKAWLGKPGAWSTNPLDAFYSPAVDGKAAVSNLPGTLGAFIAIAILFAVATGLRGNSVWKSLGFLVAFPPVFLLATLAYAMSTQAVVNAYNLEYALWALLLGLIISNTVGTPAFCARRC